MRYLIATCFIVLFVFPQTVPAGSWPAYFYVPPFPRDGNLFLPLDHRAQDSKLADTVYALTPTGLQIPVKFQKQQPPITQSLDFVCDAAAYAVYSSSSLVNDIDFIFRKPLEAPAEQIYKTNDAAADGRYQKTIDKRLGKHKPHGYLLNKITVAACNDKPTIQLVSFVGKSTYVYFESSCTQWGGEGLFGSRFVGLYRVSGEALEPIFEKHCDGKTGYVHLASRVLTDLDRNGRVEALLKIERGVSGELLLVEFSDNSYKKLETLRSSSEGEYCYIAPFADKFLSLVP